MVLRLDLPTLQAASILASVTFAVMYAWLWRHRPADRWFVHWAASMAVYAGAILAFALVPSHKTTAIGAVLRAILAVSNLLVVTGMRSFDGRRAFSRWMIAPPAVAAVAGLLPGWLGRPDFTHIGGICGLALAMTITAGSLLVGKWNSHAKGRRTLAFVLLGYVPGYLVAIATELVTGPAIDLVGCISLLLDQSLMLASCVILLALPGERALLALREDARRDALTGVANRTWLNGQRDRWLAAGTAVVLIDIDHFKAINDGHGHAAGDAVLVALADRLGEIAACAPTGAVVRLGGDEFLMLLGGCTRESATALAEAALDAAALRSLGVPAWTSSIGVARVEPGETDLGAALGRADAALYRAKLAGRARVAA